jgi:hypothetical protein
MKISELHKLIVEIQTAHDKVCSQNGNSREHVLRSQNWLLSEIKEVILSIQLWSELGSR